MRFEVTRATELSIRALSALVDRGDWTTRAELAEIIGTSSPFLAQVMAPLAHQGWVESKSGVNGGYVLTEEARGLSVLDVLEAVEGPIESGRCVLAGGPCGGESICAMHDAWVLTRKSMIEVLAAVPALEAGRD